MIKSIIKAAKMYLGNLNDNEIIQLSKDLSLEEENTNLLSKIAEEYEEENTTHQDESFEDED